MHPVRLLFSFLFWSAPVYAADLGWAHDRVMAFFNQFPDSKGQCVAKTYSESLGLSAYESREQVTRSNLGVIENNKDFLAKSPCFSTLVHDFYKDIPDLENGRASLADKAGKGTHKQFQSGWVWEKALKVTQGDKSLAMALLNVCLNDDVAYTAKIKVRVDHADLASAGKRADFLKTNIADFKEKLSWKLTDFERKDFLERIAKSEAELAVITPDKINPGAYIESNLRCPDPKSAAFLPGSLAADADIPENLKNPIAELLGSDTSSTAAKHYHVYSAAAMGCALAKCGIGEDAAKRMQDTLARSYRGFRLCTTIKDARPMRKAIDAKTKGALSDSAKREEVITNLLAANSHWQIEAILGEEFCSMPATNRFCYKVPNVRESAQKAKYVRMLFDGLDAAQLFDDGKLAPHDSVPCSFAQYSGPKMDYDKDEAEPGILDRLRGRNACQQPSWSKERCNGALKTLRSWEVDEDWSRLAHNRGVVFGMRECKGQPVGQAEERACRILGTPGTPANGSEGTAQ